ncbi:hypothetical protein MG290_11055 [Flavobacterium sp. CBA20B-1]|uniref:hypothetical protein n=1 Tax=unclassified Flavobacterium TaxID=196869 RepID=UPI00222576D1|nr:MULTISPECIES: hypothetical protein [unclassified Flavobacterium]WCM41485.1 hypothetical protein MG290_11055 [Flavobacterium sp. CBA20B-1]
MKTLLLFFSLLCISNIHAQTYRDSLASQIIHNFPKDETTYQKLKADIKELEKLEEKPNPEILHSKLSSIYKFKDIDYFKEILTLLTRYYGYNVSYLSGKENYYESIIYGNLSNWFKEMYIKNHSEWLSENLDKQKTIFELNTLADKDQIVNGISTDIYQSLKLNEEQKQIIDNILDKHSFNNAQILLDISSKIGSLPTGNSFSLIQKDYGYVELHNLQRVNNFEKLWTSFYPLYKTSYLNKDISSIKFRTIDFTKYRHDGKQIFNLIKIEDFHESWRNNPNDKDIPLADPEQTKKLRQELGWE